MGLQLVRLGFHVMNVPEYPGIRFKASDVNENKTIRTDQMYLFCTTDVQQDHECRHGKGDRRGSGLHQSTVRAPRVAGCSWSCCAAAPVSDAFLRRSATLFCAGQRRYSAPLIARMRRCRACRSRFRRAAAPVGGGCRPPPGSGAWRAALDAGPATDPAPLGCDARPARCALVGPPPPRASWDGTPRREQAPLLRRGRRRCRK